MEVKIIGAGLAGSEAAYQLAQRGIKVKLYEMRPVKSTPAHHTDKFAELVCSNSLRSNQIENAVGLLKEEMRRMNSLIMKCADSNTVPAGGALAVDRVKFSSDVTDIIKNHPNIEVIHEEVTNIDDNDYTIIASGPLTSEALFDELGRFTDNQYLYFYDAAAPIVSYESINKDKVFRASRYEKGDDDYLNCPMNKSEYELFYKELVSSEKAEMKNFEKQVVFEGCMPIEKMAERGPDTMLFGPLKPVGLSDPRSEIKPYAVVQLRQDNSDGTLYNIVGFQTHLKWGEQKRVFGLIPGLENAEFVRYGVMHRNTFINSTKLLTSTLQMRQYPKIMFAGQITGVEGYIESAAMGLFAGLNMWRLVQGEELFTLTKETAMGALASYISDETVKNFQPMNINFGIMSPIGEKIRDKRLKNQKISERSLKIIDEFVNKLL